MDNRENSLDRLKQTDLVDYLGQLGFKYDRQRGNDFWFCSPLREERTASFKVNRSKNVWYDHGIGEGGTIIDFGTRYFKCSIQDFIQKFSNTVFIPQKKIVSPVNPVLDNPLKIISATALSSFNLLRYLRQRRISQDAYKKHCLEVAFELKGKHNLAIGFANDRGGYELRNQWFKGSSTPKAITTILLPGKSLNVFEGFFDFLSFKSVFAENLKSEDSFIILNSAAFIESARVFMEKFERVHLFLDRDNTGLKSTQKLLKSSQCYIDESHLYKGYKDLNEWIQQIGKGQNQRQRPNNF